MRVEEIMAAIAGIRPTIEAEGVSHLSIFGSRARGEARPDSDLDLLIEVDPEARFSILNLVGVEQAVGEATGLKANAVMLRSLAEPLRAEIAADIRPVF